MNETLSTNAYGLNYQSVKLSKWGAVITHVIFVAFILTVHERVRYEETAFPIH